MDACYYQGSADYDLVMRYTCFSICMRCLVPEIIISILIAYIDGRIAFLWAVYARKAVNK
jgi:hypothetical protein